MATRDKFSLSVRERQNRYFSVSFKQSKVRELEQRITTVREICRTYEVSKTAVYKWLDKYSVNRQKGVRLIVEELSDTRKIEVLKQRIAELERLVGQKQIQLEFKDKMIELAEEQYQVDIKKKFGSLPSAGSGKTGNSTAGK